MRFIKILSSYACKGHILPLFFLFASTLGAEVLFREDFSDVALGRFPSTLNYAGNFEGESGSSLLEAYQDFHVTSNVAFVTALAAEVRAAAAKRDSSSPFTLSGNLSSAIMEDSRWLEIALALDYLNKEHYFRKGQPDEESLISFYKVSEALGRQAMMMPSASNNAAWVNQEDPKFYNFITAQAYAYAIPSQWLRI